MTTQELEFLRRRLEVALATRPLTAEVTVRATDIRRAARLCAELLREQQRRGESLKRKVA